VLGVNESQVSLGLQHTHLSYPVGHVF